MNNSGMECWQCSSTKNLTTYKLGIHDDMVSFVTLCNLCDKKEENFYIKQRPSPGDIHRKRVGKL